MKLKVHPAVFYRRSGEQVVLYHTGQQKIFTFSEGAADILDFFGEWASVEDLAAHMGESFEGGVEAFVDELVGLGIVEREYTQTDPASSLEREVSIAAADERRLRSVTFELTYICNERCRHCYVAGKQRPELSTSQIMSVLDDLAEMEVLNVVFTGGELFTRKDAFEILEYAYAKHFLIDVFTNGTLLDGDGYIRLKSVWPRSVQFSLYSHIPERHDSITRVAGSFEKTLKAIRSCSLIGIPVNIKTPVFSETMDDIEGMVALANSLGVSIELGDIITPKKDGDLAPTSMRVRGRENVERVYEMIRACTGDGASTEREEVAVSERLCNAGEGSLSINPYGEVYPCVVFPLCVGDVTKQPIGTIWRESDTLRWWRANNVRSHRVGCEGCGLAGGCAFCPGEAMLRQGSPLARYENACADTKAYQERRDRRRALLNV